MLAYKKSRILLCLIAILCTVEASKPSPSPSPSPMSNGVCTYNKDEAPCVVDCTCFDFELISYTVINSQTTLVWEVADNCKWEVSYIAFGSAGLSIASPKDGSTYVGVHSTYSVVYTTMSGNPGFQSVKFQVQTQKDYNNGAKERFTIVLNQPLPCDYKFSLQGHAAQVYDTFSGYSIDDCIDDHDDDECPPGYGGPECADCANPADTPGWTYWCMPLGTTPKETYTLTLQNCEPSKNNCPAGGFSPYSTDVSPGGYEVDCNCDQNEVPCPNNCYGNGICYYQNGTCGCTVGEPPYCAIASPSATPSRTPSSSPSQTPSNSPSASASASSSTTPSSSASTTPSRSPSASSSVSPSPSASTTPSRTPSSSPSVTPTPSSSPTSSVSATPSSSPSPSRTPSSSPSMTPSNSPSRSPSSTPSITPSSSPSVTPSRTPTPSVSASNAPSGPPSVTPSGSASVSITPSSSVTPSTSVTPTVTPTVSVTPSPSITPSPTSSVSASPSPSSTPSTSVTPSSSSSPSSSVTPTPSETPSSTPSMTPSSTPSITPSETPSPSVSATPSTSVTPSITPTPSISATPSPSSEPTPSVTPSPIPEVYPCEQYDFCSGRGLCEGNACNCTETGYLGTNCTEVPPVFDCGAYTDCTSCQNSALNCSWCIGQFGNSACVPQQECSEGNTTVSCSPTTVNYEPDPCPNGCSGHGSCDDGKCDCSAGWTGDDCGSFDSVTVGAAVGGAVIGLIVMGAVVFALLAGGGAAYYKYNQLTPGKSDPVQDNPLYEGNEPKENPLYEEAEMN